MSAAGQEWLYHPVHTGNAHAVIFVDNKPSEEPVDRVGSAMQDLPEFPDGVNVGFVRVQSDGSLVQRTYERGSGETLACGTGATAAACAALDLGLVPGPRVAVQLLGGVLVIDRGAASAVMEGPARTVFSGKILLPIT